MTGKRFATSTRGPLDISNYSIQSINATIDFSHATTFTIALLDQNDQNESSASAEEIDLMMKYKENSVALFYVNYSRSLLLNFTKATFPSYQRFIRFSGSTDELTIFGNEPLEAPQTNSICSFSEEFKIQGPPQSILPKMNCSPPMPFDCRAMCQIRLLAGAKNEVFIGNVHIFFKPKLGELYLGQKMIIMLNNTNFASRSELERFVKFELGNPDARLVEFRGELIVFVVPHAFSVKTYLFVHKSCCSVGWNDRPDLFSLADDQQMQRLLERSTVLKSFWNGNTCPVKIGPKKSFMLLGCHSGPVHEIFSL